MHSALENALDVPHTRSSTGACSAARARGITITAKVERTADRVVAEYVGEPRPTGIVARILSPSGGLVTHFDRFILPRSPRSSTRSAPRTISDISSAMTPISDFVTRIFAVVSFKMRLLPAWLLKPIRTPARAPRVPAGRRDARAADGEHQRFGGEQFASTEIDVLGPHIWRLFKTAERGGVGGEQREEVQLVV